MKLHQRTISLALAMMLNGAAAVDAGAARENLRKLSDNDDACGRDSEGILGECRLTRGHGGDACTTLYPDLEVYDCKKGGYGDSHVGECFCGDRDNYELCGCIGSPPPPPPTPPPCPARSKTIKIREIFSPGGPKHTGPKLFNYAPDSGTPPKMSNGDPVPDELITGDTTGTIWFANNLFDPNDDSPLGTETGHCVEVWQNQQLACYFRFDLGNGDVITAEALFDEKTFASAFVITGGTGHFLGIVGGGKTIGGTMEYIDYELCYKILE